MEALPMNPPALSVRVRESQGVCSKVQDAKGNVLGAGHFFLHVEVTALTGTVYLPLSIASGKKPTGFVYQIEGTGPSSIVTADVRLRDVKKSGVTQILLGTVTYVEIPQGMTAILEILIDMKGKLGKEYAIAITSMQYKRSPSDARYQKHVEELRTGTVRFH